MKRNLLLQFALVSALASAAKADVYTVTLNTNPLVGNGPFMLDLQFLDGSGTPPDLNNNVVMLTGFAFGAGGGALGGGTPTGGASGSLTAGVTLKDTVFFNEYIESFTPGPLLSFTLNTTNNPDPGGTPDLFTLAILDGSGTELPTTGPADEFLDVALTGGVNAQVTTYGSAPGSAFLLGAPVLTNQNPSSVPEPSTLSMLLVGGFGWWAWRRARRRGLS
jgi:hypothetical protein